METETLQTDVCDVSNDDSSVPQDGEVCAESTCCENIKISLEEQPFATDCDVREVERGLASQVMDAGQSQTNDTHVVDGDLLEKRYKSNQNSYDSFEVMDLNRDHCEPDTRTVFCEGPELDCHQCQVSVDSELQLQSQAHDAVSVPTPEIRVVEVQSQHCEDTKCVKEKCSNEIKFKCISDDSSDKYVDLETDLDKSDEKISVHYLPCDSSEDESDQSLSEVESEMDCGDIGSMSNHATSGKESLNNLHSRTSSRRNQDGGPKNYNRDRYKIGNYVNAEAPTIEYYEMQMEFLERCNKKLTDELAELRNKIQLCEKEHILEQNRIKAEYEKKLEKISNQCEVLHKEKEAMVIRYAKSEKEVIVAKKIQNELEKKMKECSRERDNLSSRVKMLASERTKLCNSLDNKMVEFANLQKEHEKSKEIINSKDIKIKWAQTKLKTEMDSHKDTQAKLEHTLHRLQETREEAEQVRKDCQEMIRRYQEAEEIKSVSLDHQLKQKLSELEIQKQERSDQEEVYQLLKQELEALKKKQRITIEENNSLTLKIHSLEKERLEYEQTLSKLKDNQNSYKQEVVDLMARIAEMENISMQLEREKEKLAASLREVERLRQTNAELQSDMDACHNKEGELLEFTERLTAKTVQLQSEHSLLEAKAQTLEEELIHMNKKYAELEQKNQELLSELNDEQRQRQEETELLARKLAEKTKTVEQLNTKLGEADNENRVMKRRHITSIKELSRELQQCRKKLEVFESSQTAPGESLSQDSRASSSGSLDNIANNNQLVNGNTPSCGPQAPPAVVFSGGKGAAHVQNKNGNQNSPSVSAVPNEIDKHMLIERIIRLQKILARKNDKIEFLEEHVDQLIKEIKKKSKIIQNYIMREETGALVPNSSDQNKLELSRRGGIMASVYSSQLADSHMTLDLSLEINHKLQAVLEDTLLKNITLKENINTLGEEIARLTSERRELSDQLSRHKNMK